MGYIKIEVSIIIKISEYFDQLQTKVYKMTLVITVSVVGEFKGKIAFPLIFPFIFYSFLQTSKLGPLGL